MTIDQKAKALLLREEAIVYFTPEKTHKHYYLIDDMMDGEYKEWREDDQLSRQGFYKNDKLNDEYKIWNIFDE
ncbi:MAG TPA: hypothetical protein P5277_05090 [Candidatus Paceibacterota bacterium]|nr:hypothetical protein [Candidatus Paceibacterota bacterium]